MRRLLLPAFLWLLVVIGAATCARADVEVTMGPIAWHAQITSTVVWSYNESLGKVTWSISHSSSYTGTGSFSISKNGSIVASYPGTSPGEPFNASQNGFVTGVNAGDSFTTLSGVLFQFVVPDDEILYKITVTLPANNSEFPLTYRLMQGMTQIGSDIVRQPGAPALIQSFTLYTDEEVHVDVLLEGYEFDGAVWVKDPEAVTMQRVTDAAGGATPVVVASEEEEVDNFSIPKIDTLPGGKEQSATSGGSVWNANTATDTVSKSLFREGVDKITARQDRTNEKLDAIKDALTTGEAPDLEYEESLPATKSGTNPVERADNMIPSSAPTFFTGTVPTNVHTLGFTSPAITVAGKSLPAGTISVDLSEHITAISLFRAVCSVVLWMAFFLLTVRTIRSAGAGNS